MRRRTNLRVSRESAYVVRAAESPSMPVPAKSTGTSPKPTERDIALARAIFELTSPTDSRRR